MAADSGPVNNGGWCAGLRLRSGFTGTLCGDTRKQNAANAQASSSSPHSRCNNWCMRLPASSNRMHRQKNCNHCPSFAMKLNNRAPQKKARAASRFPPATQLPSA